MRLGLIDKKTGARKKVENPVIFKHENKRNRNRNTETNGQENRQEKHETRKKNRN